MSSAFLKINIAHLLFNLVFLLLLRVKTGNDANDFLVWNLFLAFLPLAFALLLTAIRAGSAILSAVLALLWLLFYPNAPYMITDLIHIDVKVPIDPSTGDVKGVLWVAVLIFSFAMQALLFGFYSIKLIRTVLLKRFSRGLTEITIGLSLTLSSFGIYLGRILRLNSWDALTHPLETLLLILEHLFPPTKNPETYLTIIVFTAVQYLLVRSIHALDEKR